MRPPFRCLVLLMAIAAATAASPRAEARKFDFSSEWFATYFGGSYGMSNAGDSAYGSSSGAGVTVDKKASSAASGEFGIMLSFSKFNLKLGAELVMPKELTEITGSNASGTALFSLHSKTYAVIPTATLEFPLRKGPSSKTLLGLGLGWATVTIDNTYEMTAAGSSQFGTSGYRESGNGTCLFSQAYVGQEFLFTDNVTMAALVGYRVGNVRSFASSKNVTTISGAQTEGGLMKNSDGTDRSLNIGGAFAGLSFRFYL